MKNKNSQEEFENYLRSNPKYIEPLAQATVGQLSVNVARITRFIVSAEIAGSDDLVSYLIGDGEVQECPVGSLGDDGFDDVWKFVLSFLQKQNLNVYRQLDAYPQILDTGSSMRAEIPLEIRALVSSLS